jgi:helix-turn-helix protein
MNAPRGLLILADAAEVAGLAPVTLRLQIARGRLKGVKIGRDWWVREKDLRAYMATISRKAKD